MQERWIIFKDGKTLGPLTPEEIREALRNGTIDPFDQVAREGSTVRRELIEVDELFASSKVVYGEAAAANEGFEDAELEAASGAELQGKRSPSAAFVPVVPAEPVIITGSYDVGKNADDGAGHTALAQTDYQMPPMRGQGGRKREPKHFHLQDKSGRVLGPLSAVEVQALFFKGVLDKSVKVMREGSSARVPVARFVSTYAENGGGFGMPEPDHPGFGAAGGPPPPLRPGGNYPQRQFQQQQSGMSGLAIAMFAVAILLLAAALWVVKEGRVGGLGVDESPPRHSEHHTTHKASKTEPKSKHPAPAPTAAPTKEPKAIAVKKPPKVVATPTPTTAPKPEKTARPTPKPHVRAVPAPIPAPAPAPAPAPIVVAPTPRPPPPSPQPPPQRAMAVRVAPVAPAAPPPTAVPALVDGQAVAHYGPMSFDRGGLQACTGNCSLQFVGPNGPVTVAFFKKVWGGKLQAAKGQVYVTGLVRKNGGGFRILLSGVE